MGAFAKHFHAVSIEAVARTKIETASFVAGGAVIRDECGWWAADEVGNFFYFFERLIEAEGVFWVGASVWRCFFCECFAAVSTALLLAAKKVHGAADCEEEEK